MTYWIIPANNEIYNLQGSFTKNGFIDWRQRVKYAVGDIVYIYLSQPISGVRYKTRVEKINIRLDETVDDTEFKLKENTLEEGQLYTRLKLIEAVDSKYLSLQYLLENGLNGAPQGPTTLTDERAELINYLDNYFNQSEKKYQWIPFYEELADKLSSYQDRKSELFEIIQNLREEYDYFDYLNFENEEWWSSRNYTIDPFSVLAVMNRGIRDDRRIKIGKIYKEAFELTTSVPTDFQGIPVLNNQRSFFADTRDNLLWKLFEEALKYAETKRVTEDLVRAYEAVREIKGNGLSMVTIALYWIRPNVFMPLDSNSQAYIASEYKLTVPTSDNDQKTYFSFLNELEQVTESLPFYEISHAAWKSVQEPEKLSTARWLELLKDPKIFTESSKITFKAILDHEGKATCTQLANEYGRTKNFYKNNAQNFGRRVVEETGMHVFTENGKERWWRVPFTGEDAPEEVAGSFYWKLRPELAAALKKIDLSAYLLYEKEQKFEELNRYFANSDEEVIELSFLEIEEIIGQPLAESATIHRAYWSGSKGHTFPRTWEYNGYRLKDVSLEKQIARFEKKAMYTTEKFLDEVYMSVDNYQTIRQLLKEKKNLILQGAPGVGKTFAAKRLAYSMMGEQDDSRIEFIQFHQNYSYEDFVMGYQPDGEGFSLQNGLFVEFCEKVRSDQEGKDYFLIIDEINRGNISKIFGELLMTIEKDYRGQEVKMAYNGEPFSVPKNLYIIGMMNTADRSLALIDYALRRRFSFYEMRPGFSTTGFKQYQQRLESTTFDQMIEQIKALNITIEQDPTLGSGFQIGHSYFTNQDKERYTEGWLKRVIQYEIIPMLQEYWFDDEEKVKENSRKLMSVFDHEG